jgi:hypothetical protein
VMLSWPQVLFAKHIIANESEPRVLSLVYIDT